MRNRRTTSDGPLFIATTVPSVSAAENGGGVSTTLTDVFDADGNVVWHRDGRGCISYAAYDTATGGLVTSIQDVDTADTASFAAATVPSGWTTPAGGGLNLVANYQVDFEGRTTKSTSPAGNVTYVTYDDVNHVTRQYGGWSYNASGSTYAPTVPVVAAWDDWADGASARFTYAYTPSASPVPAEGSGAVPNLQSLGIGYNNDGGQTIRQNDYYSLAGVAIVPTNPSLDSLGTAGSNYYGTAMAYDGNAIMNRTTDPVGTVTENIFNNRGWLISGLVGTANSTMVDVADYTHDSDGDVTRTVAHPGAGQPDRTTSYGYDSRDRLVLTIIGVGSPQPVVKTMTYDNLGEVTEAARYAGNGFVADGNNAPTPADASLMRAKTDYSYDELGQLYRTVASSVDPATGTVGASDTSNTYFDADGNPIATESPTGLWAKSVFDGCGRVIADYLGQSGGTSLSSAASVASDVILTQARFVYDADGNLIETVSKDRFGSDPVTATGPLGDAAGTGGPAARVSYADAYFDEADRPVATSNVGTDGGVVWTRPAAMPSRSANDLVTSYAYNPAGEVGATTDSTGLVATASYDALGRTTKTVADFTDGTPTSSSNQTTAYAYDGVGNVLTMTAVLPAGQPSQTTTYVYGVTTAGGSAINDNGLLRQVQYPDGTTGTNQSSGGTYNQSESYTYDALGEKTTYAKRDGTIHAYTYDSLGRPTADAITAFGANVDQAVASLGYAYNDAGLPALATSYNASGGVVNQTAETYDGFGRLASETQSTTGAVGGSTPSVGYTYDVANGDRMTGIVYPNGRTITYGYGAAGSLTSAASQLVSIGDSAGPIQSYSYLGLSTPVTFADGNGVALSYVSATGTTGDAGDIVTGLDRFGRVADQNWTGPFAGMGPSPRPTVDEQQYAYDAASNVVSRRNTVVTTQSELYAYDGLNRLTAFSRGTLNAAGTAVTGAAGTTESWAFDALGNWNGNTVNGATTTRSNSAQNQVNSVTTGSTTTTLAYDADGDTTRDQTGQQYVYDGWNRLVGVKNASGTVIAAFTYDAQGRRVTETKSGVTTSLYYTAAWQLIESRQNNTPTAQYVRSPFYVDGIVERDDAPVTTNGTTTLTRRLYAEQDANYNVTSLSNSSGSVVERYAYDPYGEVTVENVDGSVRGTGSAASSAYVSVYLGQGMRYDPNTGLYDNHARIYDPSLGRALQQDPAGYVDGPNTYQREGGDPVSYQDPTGLDRENWNETDIVQDQVVDGFAVLMGCGAEQRIARYLFPRPAYATVVNPPPVQPVPNPSPIPSPSPQRSNDAVQTPSPGAGDADKMSRLLQQEAMQRLAGGVPPDGDDDNENTPTPAETTTPTPTAPAAPAAPAAVKTVPADSSTTPAGSYDQPDGGRTDIRQGEDHGSGTTHTHDPIFNTNPQTGETFQNGQTKSGRPVTKNDLNNINNGIAPRSKPKGR